jgi:hypothetical protein
MKDSAVADRLTIVSVSESGNWTLYPIHSLIGLVWLKRNLSWKPSETRSRRRIGHDGAQPSAWNLDSSEFGKS